MPRPRSAENSLVWFLFGSRPRATLVRSAILVAAAFVLFRFVLLPVRLQGISMLPAYRDGAFNFANRLSFVAREPRRGKVVAIRAAGLRVLYVKRIVGLPRERVEIAGGTVLIDGQALSEPAVVHRMPWNLPAVVLAGDEYFVIGDNRGMPIERHELGVVKRHRIVGELVF